MQAKPTAGVDAAMAAVLENSDLLRVIFTNNISPSNFALLRRVCKTFQELLDHDDTILRATLLYSGNLLKTEMRSFLCLGRAELDALPSSKQKSYILYGRDAIDLVCRKGCAEALAKRRASEAGRQLRRLEAMWRLQSGQRLPSLAARSELEEVKARKYGARRTLGKVNTEKLPSLQRPSPPSPNCAMYLFPIAYRTRAL